MQELEKILEEIERVGNIQFASYTKPLIAVEDVIKIIRKHMSDGWISVDERLPEDVYTPSELYEKWFLVTTPFGEEKVVQRARCVPTGYVWFDGYDSQRVIAWRYIDPYRPERSEGE